MGDYRLLGIVFIVTLFGAMLLCLWLGRQHFLRVSAIEQGKISGGTKITRGSVFAVLGLLLAFTFSNSLSKFDYRRSLINNEVNALSTFVLRLDFLSVQDKDNIKHKLRDYLTERVNIYSSLPDVALANKYLANSLLLQNDLFQSVVTACAAVQKTNACMLVVPPLNEAFDIASTRVNLTQMHPPRLIYIMLLVISLVAAWLVGYDLPRKKPTSLIHLMLYAFTITIIIYVIIDMEYPRFGFVKVDAFDSLIVEMRDKIS